jgi:hypothetical protein
VRELMREFVQRQREAREQEAFLRGNVDDARAQIAAGKHASDEAVETRSAAPRTSWPPRRM